MTVEINEENPKILEFLRNHQVGILATCNLENIPHAATIYLYTDDDLTIHFITKHDTTKCRNLLDNPNAAIAVFDAESQTTVQISGRADKVTDINILENIFGKVMNISHQTSGHEPPITKLNSGKYVAFTMKPKITRMAEYVKAEHPPTDEIFEVVVKPDSE